MTTWAIKRLDDLIAGAEPPPVIRTFGLGTLDAWGAGWVRKVWHPQPELLNSDGFVFGGLIAALADQVLAFAAMTVVPADMGLRTSNLFVSYYKLGKSHSLYVEARVGGANSAAHTCTRGVQATEQ